MRELTSLEMKAVSGGVVGIRPIGRHPLLRLIAAIIIRALHLRKPEAKLAA